MPRLKATNSNTIKKHEKFADVFFILTFMSQRNAGEQRLQRSKKKSESLIGLAFLIFRGVFN
jgi:hypothetical protein